MPDFEDDIPDPVNPADRARNDELRLYSHHVYEANNATGVQDALDVVNLRGLAKYVVNVYPDPQVAGCLVFIHRMPRHVAKRHGFEK